MRIFPATKPRLFAWSTTDPLTTRSYLLTALRYFEGGSGLVNRYALQHDSHVHVAQSLVGDMGVFILFICKSFYTKESFEMISYYHHIIILEEKIHCPVNQFWAKSQQKNRKSSLNPLTKERRDLIFWGNGVIFRGESAVYAQKFVAPPKRAIFDVMLTFCAENFIKIFSASKNQMSGIV